MTYLAAYSIVMILTFVWIRLDCETGYVFDVFGKNFYWVWYESGRRWRTVATYGWRLLLFTALVFANVALAYRVFGDNPLGLSFVSGIVLHLAMLLSALAAIPWVSKAHQVRWRRSLRKTSRKLTCAVQQLFIDHNALGFQPAAELAVEPSWTAWYPSMDQLREWKGEAPFNPQPLIFYVGPASVLVMVAADEFLAWNAPQPCPGTTLPFHGPMETGFLVTGSRRLQRGSNWLWMSTELVFCDRFRK